MNASVFIGRHRLIAELGHGGMADVYLSVIRGPAGFKKLQVVKVLRPAIADNPEMVRMFLDECCLSAEFNHPHIVQTNELAREGEKYYAVMEFLDGQPLHQIISRAPNNFMPLVTHLKIISDVLNGLHAVHTLKAFDGTPMHIVHRDVSPQNVFVTYDGQVKVVDFGIASTAQKTKGKPAEIQGKIPYMAPEQAMGGRVDGRADVFALGVMMYEALTHQRMWGKAPDTQILVRLGGGQIPTIAKGDPDVQERLRVICNRALEHDPEDRFASALDFQNELDRFMMERGWRVTQRELGDYVEGMFAEERATIRRTILSQLARVESIPADAIVEEEELPILPSAIPPPPPPPRITRV